MALLNIKAMERENTYPVCKSSGLRQFTVYTLPLSGMSSQAKALTLWLRVILSPSPFVILTLNGVKGKNLIQGKLREGPRDEPIH